MNHDPFDTRFVNEVPSPWPGGDRNTFANPLGQNRRLAAFAGATEAINLDGLPRVPGLASVHVQVQYDEQTTPAVEPPSMLAKLITDIQWSTDAGQCFAQVDISQGGCWTMGGAKALNFRFSWDRIDPLVAAVVTRGVQIGLTVHWVGSLSPKPAYATSPRESFASATTSARRRIPARAQRVSILTDTPAELANVTLDLYTDAALIAAVYKQLGSTLEPFGPVVLGAQFYSLTYSGSGTPKFTPVWELSL